MQYYSAKKWGAISLYLTDQLISVLREKGVLTEADVKTLHERTEGALKDHGDQEVRNAVDLFQALYRR
jgi:hypothetical protein